MQVKSIVLIGVRYFLCRFVNVTGRSLSVAIANGKRDDASTPEFAMDTKVRTPIIAII